MNETPFRNNQTTRPEFEIYIDKSVDTQEEYVKLPKCLPNGTLTRWPGANSVEVPLEEKELVVKLPDHRVFFLLGPDGPERIEGIVNLPIVSSLRELYSMHMSAGALIEVDSKFIAENDYYRRKQDINHKIITPDCSYLFVGQLALWRGNKVTTVGYLEVEPEYYQDQRSWSNLSKNINLPPLLSLLEQAHLKVVKGSPDKQNYVGTRVLEYASSIHFGNKHLVDLRNYQQRR